MNGMLNIVSVSYVDGRKVAGKGILLSVEDVTLLREAIKKIEEDFLKRDTRVVDKVDECCKEMNSRLEKRLNEVPTRKRKSDNEERKNKIAKALNSVFE